MSSPGDGPDSGDDRVDSEAGREVPDRTVDDRTPGPEPSGTAGGDGVSGSASPPAREEWRSGDDQSDPPPAHGETGESSGWRIFVYDIVSSILAVLVVGAYLYAISGVWPPLVAVESRSMTPNMQVNDLVFVMEADRFPGPEAHGDTGVVTARTGEAVGYHKFGGFGDVVVYERDGNGQRVPIIHRAMFWVEEGENWYDRADPDYIGSASECGDTPAEGLRNCPAPHAGFVTKGDSNGRYDQVSGLSGPVKPEWVVGTAQVRIPGLGWIRLQSGAALTNETRAVAG